MKVSIITVCWNSEQYIADAIQSVLDQSYKDIEYILVDGNSKDKTVDVIRSFESKFSGKLKWVSEPDKGLYDAMNKGIKMATGDVVGIVNSDDFLSSPDVVQKVVDSFNNGDHNAVYGDVRFVHPKNLNKTVRYYSSKVFKPALFRFGFMPAHPSFYVKRSFFDSIGYYKLGYKIAADYELLIRFLYTNKLSTQYLPFSFVTMRTGGVSTESPMSRYVLNKEIVRGCKENGIYTNMFLLSFKYFIKGFELFFTK